MSSNRTLMLIAFLTGCATANNPGPTTASRSEAREGFIQVEGGKVWYRSVGQGTQTPLLVLHGGPGVPHDYLQNLAALGDERPVIFFDQLGCGKSERPDNPALWTTPRALHELAQVRDALGLKEVFIYGHSWGSILATEYALTKPTGVRGLVLAGPALSLPRWQQDAARLLKTTLPQDQQELIHRHDRGEKVDDKQYQAAIDAYYKQRVCRVDPWPKELNDAFAGIGEQVYVTMNGPNEFTATGTLKDVDLTARLKELSLPVLFTCGRHDEATPETAQFYAAQVAGAQLKVFENSSHTPNLEEPQAYVATLREWLNAQERASTLSLSR